MVSRKVLMPCSMSAGVWPPTSNGAQDEAGDAGLGEGADVADIVDAGLVAAGGGRQICAGSRPAARAALRMVSIRVPVSSADSA